MVTDWFLKAGVHFAVVENIQITLNTLDRIITVYHKTSLCALPSSPVNRPKGREGILWKQHISKDTDTPSLFLPRRRGEQQLRTWTADYAAPTGHTKTPCSSSSVHRLLLTATSKPWVCKTGFSECYWTEHHCSPHQAPAGREQMWHWHVCARKGRKGLGKKQLLSGSHFLEGQEGSKPLKHTTTWSSCQDMEALHQLKVSLCLQGTNVPLISMTENCTVVSPGIFQ